jgi:hypothetical protein
MQTTKPKGPQLVRPGPIGLGIRVLLGATVLYWFAALLTKWNGFLERDPIESGRLYTLFTIWWLPEVFALTFRRPWGLWPAVVFLAGGAAIGLAGSLTGGGVWNPVLAGWTYAGDLLAWGALAVSFPVAIVTRSPGCQLGALPWLLAGRERGPRRGGAVPWAWTASTPGRPHESGDAKERNETRSRPAICQIRLRRWNVRRSPWSSSAASIAPGGWANPRKLLWVSRITRLNTP